MTRRVAVLVAGLAVTGCVAVPPEQRVEHDPWESVNRGLYHFNDTLDRYTTKPIARGYRKIFPAPVRQGVTNFGHNLMTPSSALNNFLQGKPGDGVREIGRFLINTSVGIGGIFDVAANTGLEPNTEDFGQTAAVWGVPDGPFVMLPLRGPRTLRDAILMPLDFLLDPLYHYDNSSVRDPLYVLRIINQRAQLLELEELLADSKDPYITLRESYLQNREFEVYDGNPPSEDDELFDEFFDEEEDN
jgi:phospholipid-binding lipoprotein MlaA